MGDPLRRGQLPAVIVSEIFGPTVQGEGPSIGRRCSFVRLGRCNLTCTWCDTPYTWDWKGRNGVAYDPKRELAEMPIREVTANIESTGVDHVVITGGEPLLQMAELEELCSALLDCGLTCEIETNGTRAPTQRLSSVVQQFNVSPKLANSGTKRDDRLKPDVLAAFCEKGAAFKFVARDTACLDEIEEIQRAVGIPNQQMWVMPEGRSAGELQSALNNVNESVIGRGWNLTTRLHVLLWGDERGR